MRIIQTPQSRAAKLIGDELAKEKKEPIVPIRVQLPLTPVEVLAVEVPAVPPTPVKVPAVPPTEVLKDRTE